MKLSSTLRGPVSFAAFMLPLGIAFAFQVTTTQDLAFGAIVTGPLSGSVTVPAIGTRSCSGGLTCLGQEGYGASRFQLTDGVASTNFSISLPSSVQITDSSGNTMTIDGFTDSLGGVGQFNSFGNASFNVGATLHVSSNQAPGSYAGSFSVMIDYQ